MLEFSGFCADERCDRDHSTCDGRTELCIGRGPAWPDYFRSNDIIARRQADMALRLWRTANISVAGASPLGGPSRREHAGCVWAPVTVKVTPHTDLMITQCVLVLLWALICPGSDLELDQEFPNIMTQRNHRVKP